MLQPTGYEQDELKLLVDISGLLGANDAALTALFTAFAMGSMQALSCDAGARLDFSAIVTAGFVPACATGMTSADADVVVTAVFNVLSLGLHSDSLAAVLLSRGFMALLDRACRVARVLLTPPASPLLRASIKLMANAFYLRHNDMQQGGAAADLTLGCLESVPFVAMLLAAFSKMPWHEPWREPYLRACIYTICCWVKRRSPSSDTAGYPCRLFTAKHVFMLLQAVSEDDDLASVGCRVVADVWSSTDRLLYEQPVWDKTLDVVKLLLERALSSCEAVVSLETTHRRLKACMCAAGMLSRMLEGRTGTHRWALLVSRSGVLEASEKLVRRVQSSRPVAVCLASLALTVAIHTTRLLPAGHAAHDRTTACLFSLTSTTRKLLQRTVTDDADMAIHTANLHRVTHAFVAWRDTTPHQEQELELCAMQILPLIMQQLTYDAYTFGVWYDAVRSLHAAGLSRFTAVPMADGAVCRGPFIMLTALEHALQEGKTFMSQRIMDMLVQLVEDSSEWRGFVQRHADLVTSDIMSKADEVDTTFGEVIRSAVNAAAADSAAQPPPAWNVSVTQMMGSSWVGCSHLTCSSLAGDSEMALPRFSCKCMRVWYCSGECKQRAWAAGHEDVCD